MFGRFELLDRIGLGGMAEVWRARVAGVGGFEKILVVKKILPAFSQNKTFIDMLLAEARLCAVLQHTNIVQTYENGEIDGQYYIAMEYVAGPDLFKVLSRATQVQQRIPYELCLFIAAEVAKGLHYAHNARDHYGRPLHIIHRDVSPSNIIVSEAGEVKVMDFGVARATPGGQQSNEQATRSGVLKGKLGYMSPEQVTGQPFDHRSDIFSLGIILYESLTLKRLFLAKTDLETLVNIRDARIEHKFRKHAYIDEGGREILRRALSRDPRERYPTAMAMHDDIVKLLFEQKIQVSNNMLSNFVAKLFDPASQPARPPLPMEPAPITRPQRVVPSSTMSSTSPSYVPGSQSLSFSPDDMKKIRDKIAEKRGDGTTGQQPAQKRMPSPELAPPTAIPAPRPAPAEPAVRPASPPPSLQMPVLPPTPTPQPPPSAPSSSPSSAQPAVRASQPFPAFEPATTPSPERAQVTTNPRYAPLGGRPSRPAVPAIADGPPFRRTSPVRPEALQTQLTPAHPEMLGGTDGELEVAGVRDAPSALGFETMGRPEPVSYTVATPSREPPPPTFRLRTGDGQEFGPLAQINLEAMLRARTASADDLVSVNDGPFQTIRSVAALQPAVQAASTGPDAPTAQGPLTQWAFVQLVYAQYASRSTGCLELRRGDMVKTIYFRRGRTQYIASNQHAELLGPFMVANGFISQADVDMAMARARSTGGRLGDLLIGLNLIKPFQLFQVLERQLRAKFIDAFGWDSGTFAWYENAAPPNDIVPLDIDPITVLAEGVRERVPLSALEPMFEDKLDKPLYRSRNPLISVGSLRLQSRESKALSTLLAARTPRQAYEECMANRPQRLALLHVLFLMLQTDLLTFDPEKA